VIFNFLQASSVGGVLDYLDYLLLSAVSLYVFYFQKRKKKKNKNYECETLF